MGVCVRVCVNGCRSNMYIYEGRGGEGEVKRREGGEGGRMGGRERERERIRGGGGWEGREGGVCKSR